MAIGAKGRVTSCHGCGADLRLAGTVGRRDTCSECDADLHACVNCHYYDETAPHQCREPHADHHLDKEQANPCELFQMGDGASRRKSGSSQAARDSLSALFGEAPRPAAPDPKDELEALFRKR